VLRRQKAISKLLTRPAAQKHPSGLYRRQASRTGRKKRESANETSWLQALFLINLDDYIFIKRKTCAIRETRSEYYPKVAAAEQSSSVASRFLTGQGLGSRISMATTATKVRIFVASPSDTGSERQQLSAVTEELNVLVPALAPEKKIVLQLVKWETSVAPGMGRDAQEVVNKQIGEYDIFVGIIWKRMGTPTAVAQSGTEEEFRRAYAEWQRNKGLRILFYFSQAPYTITTGEDAEQLGRVIAFRDEVRKLGLVWEYPSPERFADVIRPHLALALGQMFSGGESSRAAAATAKKLNPSTTTSSVRMDVIKLAEEYVEIRRDMRSGEDRTRLMTAMAAELRSFAPDAFYLVPELIISPSAGERLAAICILQQIPDKAYLNWLAERVAVEKPFPGYHATLALLRALRAGGHDVRPAIAVAVGRAKALLSLAKWQNPDEVSTIKTIEEELGPIEIPPVNLI
jgi:hypothetical protein